MSEDSKPSTVSWYDNLEKAVAGCNNHLYNLRVNSTDEEFPFDEIIIGGTYSIIYWYHPDKPTIQVFIIGLDKDGNIISHNGQYGYITIKSDSIGNELNYLKGMKEISAPSPQMFAIVNSETNEIEHGIDYPVMKSFDKAVEEIDRLNNTFSGLDQSPYIIKPLWFK